MNHAHKGGLAVLLAVSIGSSPPFLAGQEDAMREVTWELAGLPAINYDSDEGFGYGAIAEVYRHAPDAQPYLFTVQPAVLLSTRGRRDMTVFFDAPNLRGTGWRLDAFAGREKQLASPFYGAGNATAYDPALDDPDGPSPYYYRFGRTRTQGLLNVQRPLAWCLRALFGAGVAHVSIDPTPYDNGTTLLAEQLPGFTAPGGYSNSVRAGLIRDTRDREVGPTRGAWSEVLVQRFDRVLGSDTEYTRWTFIDRRYLPSRSGRLVFANRILLQGIEGDAPFYDLFVVQTSFKQQEGLGGAKTVRGLPKNRYAGKGIFLWNAEVRWRAVDFVALGRPLHLVMSGFFDSGRVWEERLVVSEIPTELHHGVGGGVRIGMGPTFTVAVDAAHSGAGVPIYIGLGYLY